MYRLLPVCFLLEVRRCLGELLRWGVPMEDEGDVGRCMSITSSKSEDLISSPSANSRRFSGGAVEDVVATSTVKCILRGNNLVL
jgi:hypothetical protein